MNESTRMLFSLGFAIYLIGWISLEVQFPPYIMLTCYCFTIGIALSNFFHAFNRMLEDKAITRSLYRWTFYLSLPISILIGYSKFLNMENHDPIEFEKISNYLTFSSLSILFLLLAIEATMNQVELLKKNTND